jgi:hypothetical protein
MAREDHDVIVGDGSGDDDSHEQFSQDLGLSFKGTFCIVLSVAADSLGIEF